jgi:hypothetical protein
MRANYVNCVGKLSPAPLGVVAQSIANQVVLSSCQASYVCSGCKTVSYCSKAHQKRHWPSHKESCNGGFLSLTVNSKLDASQKEFLFPEFEISVEPEEDDNNEVNDNDNDNGNGDSDKNDQNINPTAEETDGNGLVVETAPTTKIWEDALTEGGADEAGDAAITQADYNKALSEQKYDPLYVSFLTRVAKGGMKQVLRYCEDSIHCDHNEDWTDKISHSHRDIGRLFLSTENRKVAQTQTIPNCQFCSAPRALEFQVGSSPLIWIISSLTSTLCFSLLL